MAHPEVTANIIAVVLLCCKQQADLQHAHNLEEVERASAAHTAQQYVDILHNGVYQHGAERPHQGGSRNGVDVIDITPTKKEKGSEIEGT
jgi:hypothetical protein